MGQPTLLAVVLVTAGVCTANIAFGFWLGWIVRRKPRGRAMGSRGVYTAALRRAARDLGQCLSATVGLSQEAKHLSQVLASQQPATAEDPASTACRVLAAIDTLERRLAKAAQRAAESVQGASPERPSAASSNPGQALRPAKPRNPCDLTPTELDDLALASSPASPSESAESAQQASRYDAIQHVAPWTGDDLPDATAFTPIHCHKLSTAAIVYYADVPPASSQIVVRLHGKDSQIMLGARVLGHRTAYFEGRWRHRVCCQFVSRVETRSATPQAVE